MSEEIPLCVRCNTPSHDLRTLWMACLYAMHEMKDVPFVQILMKGGAPHAHVGEEEISGHVFPKYADNPSGEPHDRPYYTLRVCKACRAEWMGAIHRWFVNPPAKQESCGSGIFVRDCGALVEITEEEWRERYGDREPVRFVK